MFSSGLEFNTTYSLRSRQQEDISFRLDAADTLWINSQAKTVARDQIAHNGVMFKVDAVLYCDCSDSNKKTEL